MAKKELTPEEIAKTIDPDNSFLGECKDVVEDRFKIEHLSTSMLGVDFTDEQCKVVFKMIDEVEKELIDKVRKDIESLKNQLKFYPETLQGDLNMIKLIDKSFENLKE